MVEKFEVGKKYRHIYGALENECLFVDDKGTGFLKTSIHLENDMIRYLYSPVQKPDYNFWNEVPPPPRTKELWANMYPYHFNASAGIYAESTFNLRVYTSEKEAKRNASPLSVGRVKITLEEGKFE